MTVFRSTLLQGSPFAHGFFTKKRPGGGEAPLNVALGRADSDAVVKANRQAVTEALGARTLLMTNQGHTNKVHFVETSWKAGETLPVCDALVTLIPRVALGIYTADCVPVLLADSSVPIVGVAHGGWKGLHQGILAQTVAVMKEKGAQNILAAIGPCIQAESYTAGEEFRAYFPNDPEAFQEREDGLYVDLPGIAKQQLERLGVCAIDDLGLNTYADEVLFYSYRRATEHGHPLEGAQASAIMIL